MTVEEVDAAAEEAGLSAAAEETAMSASAGLHIEAERRPEAEADLALREFTFTVVLTAGGLLLGRLLTHRKESSALMSFFKKGPLS